MTHADYQSFLIGIISSFVSSFLFLFSILFFLRPRIKVSNFMCKGKLPKSEDNFYFIKIVNKSFFSAYDISANIYKIEKYPTPPVGMINNGLTPLTLVLNNLAHLAPYRPIWLRKEANHAYRLRSEEKLSEIVNNEFQSVRIEITAKHGLTGLTKVFIEEYAHPSQIKDGSFAYGTKIACL